MPEQREVEIKVLEHVGIPMDDGTELAARIWLPGDAEEHPVPAILEYIPYRKRDHKLTRDTQNHGYFARHDYAGVRVDLRGSGDSEGVLRDEYLRQELDDGLEVLQWIAAQSWCTGRVGLLGLSWGGFNGLQLAALRPPELGAVISVCASDDRYADDVHYMGGCLLIDNLSWASTMFGFNSCPPDPAVVGERWRNMWLDRLQGSGLWLKTWLEHQHRDAYWRHGSVCEKYRAIQVPVMAVSGWADGYTNAVFRLLEHLEGPCKGIVGGWGHRYPHQGGGQTIDFLGECLRWYDYWLKGIDTGVQEDPQLVAWMQDASSAILPPHQGHWVAELDWPSPSIQRTTYRLSPYTLYPADTEARPAGPEAMTLQSPLSIGLFAGKWCSYSESTDLPWDQRAEDGGALTFDTAPLERSVEILGKAELDLLISANKPVAMVAVRISDIAPDDRAVRVTFGVLNLTHRDGHEHPAELKPGHNLASNEISLNVVNNDARIHLHDIDLVIGRNVHERYSYVHNLYDTVRGEATHERLFEREGWRVFTRTHTILASSRTHFYIRATLDAYEGDVWVFSKSWDESIPRDLV